ncbi:MAG: TolC family protein [Prevotellaceae bacterium]|nr:TolC family protein [Prevotellaceae bacterium]
MEQCIQYALDNNIQIKQQELLVEQNKNNLIQSKFNLLPDLSANIDYRSGWGRSLDVSTYQYVDSDRSESSSITASASVPLFAGLQKQNTIKRNDIDLKTSIQDVEKLKNDIALNVAAAYLQVLLAKESVAIAEQQLVSTKDQVEWTKKMVDGGKLTLSNLLDLQSQQAGEEAQLIRAQNDLAIAFVSLKQLLELNAENDLDIITPEILSVPEDFNDEGLEKIYQHALLTQPDIKSSQLRLESAEKTLAIAKGAYYPTLSFSASYNTMYSNSPIGIDTTVMPYRPMPSHSIWKQFREKHGEMIAFNLSIPIFRGLQIRTQVKNARLNIRNYELELQKTKNTLYKSIQQAQTDAMGYLKSYQASVKNVGAIKEAFRYTEKKFNVGSVTSTDYIVAKNNLFKAESDVIQAKYQYIFKMKILDFYKGLPIKL